MIDIDIVTKLTKDVKKLGQEKDRAKGKVDRDLETLKEKFNCSSLKRGKIVLKKTDSKLERLENKFNSELDSFNEKWGKKLGEEL